jgi:O-antigen/teichoic acid export membrane protein
VLLALTFAANSALNFVLGLLIARFLGPEQFGLYALGAALLILISAFAIDWLKLSTIRFYSQDKRRAEPAIRASLDGLAALCTLALMAILLTAVVAGVDLRIPTAIAAAAVAAGATGGLFDYQQAVARAREDDAVYARMVIIKNGVALVLMVGGAWLTRDPVLVLVGSALSCLAALMVARRALSDAPLDLKAIDRRHVRAFAIYALPLVATNILLATIPLLNRAYMASGFGLAEAGYFSLAADIGFKAMATVGATIEIMLLPLAVRTMERAGMAAAHEQIGRNLIVVLACLLPLAAGTLAVLPAFEALLVPPAFQGHFSSYIWLLMPAFVALPLMQVGLNPVYLVSKRTMVSTASAAAAVAVNASILAIMLFAPIPQPGPAGVALAMSAGFVVSMLIVGWGALRHSAMRPGLRDLCWIAAGLIAMTATLWPWREMTPASLTLGLQVIAGGVIYGIVMIAGDVAGCRRSVVNCLRQRRARTAS